jgi:ZIP family zinc transporter
MRDGGKKPRQILELWGGVAIICTLATVAGYALADAAGGELKAVIDGFAAGALIVMLVDSMIPEATEQAGRTTGLITTLGFAVSAGLSAVS